MSELEFCFLMGVAFVYATGFIATARYTSNQLDKLKIDDPFFAMGAIIWSLMSWIGYIILVKQEQEKEN